MMNAAEPEPKPTGVADPANIQLVAAEPEPKPTGVADPANIQLVAAAQVRLRTAYYERQAQRSFKWALIAAGTGTAWFIIAIGVLLDWHWLDVLLGSHRLAVSILSAVGGGLLQLIAALNFWLYGRTSQQLGPLQRHLEQMQRFQLAYSVSESLPGDSRAKAKAELVRIIAT